MERLTTCSEITPETDMTQEWGYSHIYRRLAAYEDAEEQGRLVVLPCKVGDTVFKVDFGDGCSGPRVNEHIIRGFKHTAYTAYPVCDIDFFGKTVFLTREEAEAALNNLV